MILPNVSRILFIRNDGIGDLLNSTPAIRWVRRCYPEATITCLVTPLAAPMLQENPDVDRVWVQEERGWSQRLRWLAWVRCARFDVAVALQTASWPHLLVAASGARIRMGRYQKLFRRTLTHPDRRAYPKGTTPEIERNLNLVAPICAGEPPSRPILVLTPDERTEARWLLRARGISSGIPWGMIHPGGSSEDKRWPAPHFRQIIQRLEDRGVRVVLVHGPGESELARQCAAGTGAIVLEPPSLRTLAALIAQAPFFLCNDSGPMHIAAALDVPTVAIFGPTDHVRWAPPNVRVVRREISCWPCSAHRCRIGYECIKRLPVESVWHVLRLLLEAHQLPIPSGIRSAQGRACSN